MASSITWITTDAMADPVQPLDPQQVTARRRGVRRTVLVLVAIAVAFYVVFLLTGVFGNAAA